MIITNYKKVKVGELVKGDIIVSVAFADLYMMKEREVAEVFQSRRSTKTVRFADGSSYSFGNASKVLKKA